MDTTSTFSTVTGRVAQVNETGLKLEGAAGWLNLSKYAPGVVMPTRGQQVTLTLDGRGFIRNVIPLVAPSNGRFAVAPPQQPASVAPVPAPAAIVAVEDVPDWLPMLPADATTLPSTDRRICRQACMNTATAILSSGGRGTVAAEVVGLAAQLEQWVNRPLSQ